MEHLPFLLSNVLSQHWKLGLRKSWACIFKIKGAPQKVPGHRGFTPNSALNDSMGQ